MRTTTINESTRALHIATHQFLSPESATHQSLSPEYASRESANTESASRESLSTESASRASHADHCLWKGHGTERLRHRAFKRPRVTFCFLVASAAAIIIASHLTAIARQPAGSALQDQVQGRVKILEETGPWKMELLREPGTVLAEGSNTIPAGVLRLKTYRIEELTLHQPIKAEVNGVPTELNKAWRLTVIGGPFRVRDAAVLVWIDDRPIGAGLESPDLKSVSIIVFDRTLLKDHSSISLSYGERDPDRTTLPEKISLPSSR